MSSKKEAMGKLLGNKDRSMGIKETLNEEINEPLNKGIKERLNKDNDEVVEKKETQKASFDFDKEFHKRLKIYVANSDKYKSMLEVIVEGANRIMDEDEN